MKQGHITLIFFLIYLGCFLFLKVEEKQYQTVIREKQRVEQALAEAMEYTAKEYAEVMYASLEQKEKTIETTFSTTFSVLMGIPEEEKLWRMYLPLLVLVEEDGMVFCYVREVSNNHLIELECFWSDKVYFDDSQDQTVIEQLEREVSAYITKHNYIAEQYGISYTFFVPDFFATEETVQTFPMLLAVFQGWPLTASGRITYENCIDIGAYLQKKRKYVLELPQNIQYPAYCYHEISCAVYSLKSENFIKEMVTKEEAIRQYGALPCKLCIK